ncbi:response regulator [Oryzifoliimicrobium ureilyticus]|uniref:response regulator n=1 Tax=Oryzifoliimicrobium ureilyticus TaxID=3113724 RepID=UPI0030765EFD
MSAKSGKADSGTAENAGKSELSAALFDLVGDGFGAAFILYDRNDLLVFASRHLLDFYPINPAVLAPGTRVRDLLGAIFDVARKPSHHNKAPHQTRDDWISEKIALHWRERGESVESHGNGRWARLLTRRLPNGYGMCLLTDISEHKKREDQWRADMERVQLTEDILDNLPFPLFVKDRNLIYVAVNIAFCEKFNLSAEEVLGRTSRDIFSSEVAERYHESDRHVLETGEASVTVQRHVSISGVEHSVINRKQRIGKPGRYFLISTIQQLVQEPLDIEPAPYPDTVSDTDNLLHQIYIPAGAEQAEEAHRKEVLVPETFSSKRILVATNDAALEKAALQTLGKYRFEACAVHNTEELALFLELAEEAGFAIDLVLLDNQMDLACIDIAKRTSIPVMITDSYQVSHELPFRIFHHFDRGNTNQSSTVPDDGGWDITTESEQADGLDVLVAEDNDINQIVFSQILESLGYRYLIAQDGEEAVEIWKTHRPSIILMDVSLPYLNGFEATKKIRALEGDAQSPTPIIGVLTHAVEQDRERCALAGMNDAIMKPISPEVLETLFQRYLASDRVRRSA